MSVFSLEKKDNIAIVTMNDPSESQNVINQSLQNSFDSLFEDLQSDSSLKALIFRSGKPGCFLAGADISIFQTIETLEQAREGSKLLHATFQKLVDLPLVTVCAIDGVCLGGGLEPVSYTHLTLPTKA